MKFRLIFAALLASAWCMAAIAQDRAYTQGAVTQVAGIKIQSGHFDEYMAYLQNSWAKEQAALKAAGLILDYAIYQGSPRGPNDADVYLTTTYANMAALDGFDERSAPISAKVLGTTPAQDSAAMSKRNEYRQVLGIELIREIKLK